MRILLLGCLAAFLLPAQEGTVSGPRAGFVFDPSISRLRPIMGVPGASVLGDPLPLGFDVTAAVVASGQDSALVAASEGGWRFFRLLGDGPVERPVDGLLTSVERVAYSPSGKSAVLNAAGKIQILTGLPDAPSVYITIDLDSTLSALAVSDDGNYVLFATSGSVRVLGVGGDNRKLMDAAEGASLAFAAGGSDAAVSDPGGAGLVLFRDLAGAGVQSIVAAPDEGTASPVGLAFSADGRKLYLASAGARSVAAFDLQTGDRSAIACNCAPANLVSMGSLFRLNEPGQAPLWLFDAGAAEPRIVFVPSPAAR